MHLRGVTLFEEVFGHETSAFDEMFADQVGIAVGGVVRATLHTEVDEAFVREFHPVMMGHRRARFEYDVH
jgi:hypothetical protein